VTSCTVEGCVRRLRARGYCTTHYAKWQKYGDPLGAASIRPLEDRLWEKVRPTGFCWEWLGAHDWYGYGTFYVGGTKRVDRVHRVVYKILVGPIPDGMHVDHLCRNRSCCNPDHLEPVTQGENTRRGNAPNILASRTGTCARGHSLANAYIRPDTGARQCAECIRLRTKGLHR
jgi:hypothetical protein